MCRSLGRAILVVCLSLAVHAQVPDDQWTKAEREIGYLPPSRFTQLPPDIIAELESRGCRIPQSYGASEPHNVIPGEFARKGQTDWAVLCSKEGTETILRRRDGDWVREVRKQNVSSILVFWNGSEKNPAKIAPEPDQNLLRVTNEKIGFSRMISKVGSDFIMQHYKAYGGPKPPPIHHDGIDDAFLEKASVVQYFYNGKWLRLTGSD